MSLSRVDYLCMEKTSQRGSQAASLWSGQRGQWRVRPLCLAPPGPDRKGGWLGACPFRPTSSVTDEHGCLGWPRGAGSPVCPGPPLRRTLHPASCSAVAVLIFWKIFEQGAPHCHFAVSLALPGSGNREQVERRARL